MIHLDNWLDTSVTLAIIATGVISLEVVAFSLALPAVDVFGQYVEGFQRHFGWLTWILERLGVSADAANPALPLLFLAVPIAYLALAFLLDVLRRFMAPGQPPSPGDETGWGGGEFRS